MRREASFASCRPRTTYVFANATSSLFGPLKSSVLLLAFCLSSPCFAIRSGLFLQLVHYRFGSCELIAVGSDWRRARVVGSEVQVSKRGHG